MSTLDTTAQEPVTAVFSWTVKQGKEKVFEHLMHDIHKVARTFPGHMGVTTLKSPTEKDSFQTILRFDNAANLESWLHSPIRQKMMKPLEEIMETNATTRATGLETWFDIPGERVIPPPRWKMVVTTFVAIYPLSLLYALYLTPHIENLPVWVRALFLPVLAPLILTYLFMPFLTQRVFKHWLYKHSP